MYLFLTLSTAVALDTADLKKWITNNSANSKIILSEYPNLSSHFVDGFLKWSQGELSKSTTSAFSNFKNGRCSDGSFFKIVDGTKVFPNSSETELIFMNSVFLIESSYCLTDTTLTEAFDVYRSPEFRIDVMPRVKDFSIQNNTTCIRTEGVTGITLGSRYCSRSTIKQTSDYILIHNALDSRYTGADYQPLFYREEILLFYSIPNGVALYRGTFTRSVDIGFTGKYLLQNTVNASQSDIQEQYQEWLRQN